MLRSSDPEQLRRRCAPALSVVVALLGASHMASLRALGGGEEAAAVIDISGRQRMLSQRILCLALAARVRDGRPADETAGAPDERLSDAIDLFERSHAALLRGGDLGLSVAGAAERRPIYASTEEGAALDAMARGFVADARRAAGGDARPRGRRRGDQSHGDGGPAAPAGARADRGA